MQRIPLLQSGHRKSRRAECTGNSELTVPWGCSVFLSCDALPHISADSSSGSPNACHNR